MTFNDSLLGSNPPADPPAAEAAPLIVTVGPPESDSGSDDGNSAAGPRRDAAAPSAALPLHKHEDSSSDDDDDSFTVRNRYKMIKLKDRLAKAVSSVGGSTRSPSPSQASTQHSKSSAEDDDNVVGAGTSRDSHGAHSPPLHRSALSLSLGHHHAATGPHSSSNTTPQSDSEEASHASTVDLRDADAYKSRRNARPDKNEDYLAYGSYGDSHSGSHSGGDHDSDRDTVRDGSSVRAVEKYAPRDSREAAADARFRARRSEIELDRAAARADRQDRQREWERLRMHDKASIKSRRDSLASGGHGAPRSAVSRSSTREKDYA